MHASRRRGDLRTGAILTAGLGWLWLGLTEISRNVCRSIPLDDTAALR
jgi:hypothetical protein